MFKIAEGEGFEVLIGILKSRPEELYVTEKFMAVWAPSENRALIFLGDFREFDEAQIDHILNEKLDELKSKEEGES